MKILINRKPRSGPWGGGAHFVNAFHQHAGENGFQIVQHLSESPDVIFLFHPQSEDGGISFKDARLHKIWHRDTKIVIRINECDARKKTSWVDDEWIDMSEHIDHAFFVSEWMKTYFVDRNVGLPGLSVHPWSHSTWKCTSNEVLINGIDRARFVKQPKLSLTNKKTNIVCAHWSDNPLKGQDTYEFLDDFVGKNPQFTFTYIGRTKCNFKNSILLPPMPPEELVKELSRYDLCINGTYWDPGPNAVMESIAAGLPTFVRRESGGAAEFADPEHVYNSVEELKSILVSHDYKPNVDRFDDWAVVMKRFFERLKALK